jgi:hypothetical protein
VRWRAPSAYAAGFFLLAARAAAEPGSESTEPGPLSQPAAKRDKFHAALGLGPGFLYATSGAAADTRRLSGGSVSGQLLIGGRIRPRFVLGGAYLRDQIFALSATDEVTDGDEPDLSNISMVLNAFGVFGDFYLRTDGGPHVQLFLGLGSLDVRGRTQSGIDDPSGVLFSGGVGYDFLNTDTVSLGAVLRVNWAQFEVTEVNGTDVNAFLPSLLLTASLN